METVYDHKIAVLVSMVVPNAGDAELVATCRGSIDAVGRCVECMETAPA
jgi:hypothetical protein